MLAFLLEMYWVLAIAFSVLFVWQLLATLLGHFTGGEHIDAGATGHDVAVGHDVGAAGHDAGAAGHGAQEGAVQGADSVTSFKLLSVRSVTAFGLLFGWAGVLYMRDVPPPKPEIAILFSFIWGLAGMLVVSAIFYFLMRMAETGTRRLVTAVGQHGTVYMDIPAGGAGQVKTVVSGAVTFINARAEGDQALKAGTPIVVKRLLDASTVEVDKTEQ